MSKRPKRGVADSLSLAAAPTFAAMALVSAIGGSPLDAFCSGSPLGGMAPMYLLMGVFHATPWLRLSAKEREGPDVNSSRRACPRS